MDATPGLCKNSRCIYFLVVLLVPFLTPDRRVLLLLWSLQQLPRLRAQGGGNVCSPGCSMPWMRGNWCHALDPPSYHAGQMGAPHNV